ncbi:RNA-binding domain-containing protein [Pontibacter cellulosilyticus]|uniref:DNA binding domain-containing protein n=1 Tax=Pontibacter cellulosilyticus TaxID=1720253 RepID=A0A923SQF9_9BACT|nr:RNA-binding domain-containing protein [Pontibacter cellulosilyticus]MBC5995110.1 putative DNA binding domain-containing protein [Pontibacter cellulosilyticus]
MPLHVNIEDLLHHRSVESDRIEFKEGWNPDAIYRSVCAFANDFDNAGGGYIIVGIVEQDGVAKRPVKGLASAEIAEIQKKMIGFNNLIRPIYNPKVFIEEVDGQQILIIWVPGGSSRPYEVPEQVTANQKRYAYYVRRYASSVRADQETQQELISLANQVPFDDRANTQASLDDISMVLVEDHLRKVGSRLHNLTGMMDKVDVLEQMLLIEGPPEHRFPRNVALMMFNEQPDRFFPATWVDVVSFPKGEGYPEFTEFPRITGPVPSMIRRTLDLLKTNFLQEKVIKQQGRAESVRISNYPYAALEEAIANALYHRDYQVREQVEIRITPTSIVILNYGGPDRSIRQEDLDTGKIRPRRYRNRRLGDFLKELDLTEGRATGIPTIKRTLDANGSPEPSFRTDDSRSFFEVEIFCHQAFLGASLVVNDQGSDQANDQAKHKHKIVEAFRYVTGADANSDLESMVNEIGEELMKVLEFATKPVKRKEILEQGLGLANHTDNARRYFDPLLELGLLDRTIKDKLSSPQQQYYTTEKGKALMEYTSR